MRGITQLAYEQKQQKTRLANLIQTGIVEAVHAEEGLVDVAIDTLVLERIPLFTTRAGADKTYWMPSVGEQGTVLSPSGDLANAMFLVGLNSDEKPVPETDPNLVIRVWEDGAKESYDKGKHEYVFQIDENTLRKMLRGEIHDEVGSSKQMVDATKVKHEVGSNIEELTAIVLNLIGAHLFPSGLTTFQSPVGPVMFAPGPTPATAPAPPAGSSPDSDGKVTKTPPSTISGVKIKATSNISLVLPAIPVTVGGSAGTTTPGSYKATVTGTIILEFPARDL